MDFVQSVGWGWGTRDHMFGSSKVLVVVILVGQWYQLVRSRQTHDSILVDLCWLILSQPEHCLLWTRDGDLQHVSQASLYPVCSCRNCSFLGSLNFHVRQRRGRLTSRQVFFCKYFLESRACEILSAVVPHGLVQWWKCMLAHSSAHCIMIPWVLATFSVIPSKYVSSGFDPRSLEHPCTQGSEDRHFVKALMKEQQVDDEQFFSAVDKLPVLGLFLEQLTYYPMQGLVRMRVGPSGKWITCPPLLLKLSIITCPKWSIMLLSSKTRPSESASVQMLLLDVRKCDFSYNSEDV